MLKASVGLPFLSFVLQIDPSLVRQVSSDMLERRTTAFRETRAPVTPRACVSALDQDLLGVVLWFLRAARADEAALGLGSILEETAGVPAADVAAHARAAREQFLDGLT